MIFFSTIPSGLPAVWTDVKSFISGVSFDRLFLLWLGLIPLVLSLLNWLAARRQRKRIASIGRPTSIAVLTTGAGKTSRGAAMFRSVAWLCLVIGISGPRWGRGETDGVAVGRDLVIVLDLSRSMLADDAAGGKARWQSAVAGCVDLLEWLKTRGGHRVAVVIFAARPLLIVPLTTDFDHARAKLSELNGRFPPAAIRPDRNDFPSGTRIGAAVSFAVESLDQRFVDFRDVIVLSDGDDPANDREWATGIAAARKANVPLHTVGIGDPETASLIPLGTAPLEFAEADGVPDLVRTRLHEDVLTAMATEGRGQYLPARRQTPDLATFVRNTVEKNPSRELMDDQLPQKKLRSAWFYGCGALFLLLWWWRER